jgi:hypothetical protein
MGLLHETLALHVAGKEKHVQGTILDHGDLPFEANGLGLEVSEDRLDTMKIIKGIQQNTVAVFWGEIFPPEPGLDRFKLAGSSVPDQ